MLAGKAPLVWMTAIAAATTATGCASSSRETTSPGESGAALFHAHCASCHGPEGRGDGPVSPLLKVPVPDLTRIAARRDGRYPRIEIERIIDGLSPFAAHGDREMPVWGFEFFDPRLPDRQAEAQVNERVERLVEHLDSIQVRD